MIPLSLRNRPFLPIATERLTLRPLLKEDRQVIAGLANDRRVAEKTARIPFPYTLQDADNFIAQSQKNLHKGTQVILGIVRRDDNTFLGVAGLEEEIGYWLGVEYWGQGYGKEAMKALVHFAFSTLQQERLEGSALEVNIASRRIMEGLGFQQTGTKELSSLAFEGKKPGVTYTLLRKDFLDHYHAIKRPILWVVAAALINEKGELLLAERPKGTRMAGVWELPGGKMEIGETPENALIRELKEELNIDVREEDLEPLNFASYRYDTFHLIMPLYLCCKWEGNLHGVEGQRLVWTTYPEMVHYPIPPADISITHCLSDILKKQGIWT
ncbi:MAG: GNAT family N-acetyltransferase [Alphaproteobacteria bacterium]|nr:GNAT family N-acetyltransferase [Alphaproteobacteria bacterium]